MTEKDIVCRDSVSLVVPMTLAGQDASPLRDSILQRAFGISDLPVHQAMDKWMEENEHESGSGYKTETASATQAPDGFTRILGYVSYMSSRTIVYTIATDTYAPGAANGYTTADYINYSMANKEFISLADIFTPAGLKALPKLIQQQALNNPEYDGNVNITALPEAGNFYISSEGEIVFSYYPTEVGPHYLGTVQVAFYPYELMDYLTPRAKIMFNLTDL